MQHNDKILHRVLNHTFQDNTQFHLSYVAINVRRVDNTASICAIVGELYVPQLERCVTTHYISFEGDTAREPSLFCWIGLPASIV